MIATEEKQTNFTERAKDILRKLATGKTRQQLAEDDGNSSWNSIDIYMRRQNFTWDTQKQNYIPKLPPIEHELDTDSSKAGHVISLLSNDGTDAKIVAERLGFQDHKELAQYMNIRGYTWDGEVNNYVKQLGEVIEKPFETTPNRPSTDRTIIMKESISAAGFEKYIPLLELLSEHQNQLIDLVIPSAQKGTIPRFIVPGVAKTKTVQMMHPLEKLVVDFSREKNISQRELFEVALIEFFRKYGYEQEIERLLNR